MSVESKGDVQCSHTFQKLGEDKDGCWELVCTKCALAKKTNPPQEAAKVKPTSKKMLLE